MYGFQIPKVPAVEMNLITVKLVKLTKMFVLTRAQGENHERICTVPAGKAVYTYCHKFVLT